MGGFNESSVRMAKPGLTNKYMKAPPQGPAARGGVPGAGGDRGLGAAGSGRTCPQAQGPGSGSEEGERGRRPPGSHSRGRGGAGRAVS